MFAMSDPTISFSSLNGHALSFRGDSSIGNGFINAIEGLEEEATAIGYPGLERSELRDRMKFMPEGWNSNYRGPTMSAHYVMSLIELVALLRDPITKALVQVASAEFFKIALQKIGKMFEKKEQLDENIRYPVLFRPAMYFESEQVLVTALMTINKADDYKCAETLVPQAFERAVDWLERNGRQAPYITYRIEDCKLNSFPSLTHEPPAK
jgi:hypothetical protein